MTCSEFDLLSVSDDPEAAAALRDHAAGCPRCAEILAWQAALSREVETWKESAPSPPPQLEQRILKAAEQARTRSSGRLLRFRRRQVYAWGAIAATLIVAALLVARTAPWARAPQEANRLLVAEALRDAEKAEREHARAIARLEQAAAPILAQSEDQSLSASKAAILIAYRDRLAFLDSTIAEVEGFLDNNPSHSGGRTVLLAAYTEKTEVLSQIIALEEEWAS